MLYEMNLHNVPFEKIKSGNKTVEMRLFDERRKALKVGDLIRFTNNDTSEQIVVEVTNLETFANFEQLYQKYDKCSIGYAFAESANPSDMLAYYTREQIAINGVVAIGIKLK